MTVVVEDLVNGHSYRRVLAGFALSRVFHVSQLTEIPSRQLIEAANDPGIPDIGDVYPGTVGIPCVEVFAEPAGANAARVTCNYSAQANVSSYNQPFPTGNDGQDVKQVSSGVRELRSPYDRDGALMVLTPPAAQTGWDAYNSEATRFIPVGEVVFERVETSPPTSRTRALVGKINQFNLGGTNYPAGTLLFSGLDASSSDGGVRWNCTYTFQYDSAGWGHIDAFRGPDGRIPVGVSVETFDVIDHADFSGLGLDFSDSQTPIS